MHAERRPREHMPLSEADSLDIIGERREGGVDLLIVATGPLDSSNEVCRRLEEKLNTYLYAATHPNFAAVHPAAHSGRTRIFVSDAHAVSDRARRIIEAFAQEALARNVEVRIGHP
jgi:DNA-binding transcriptional LysR family regulator